MKKSVVAILTMAVVSAYGISSAHAVELGVLAGLNMAGSDADGVKSKISYAVGVSASQGVGPIAVEGDLLFVNMKMGYEINDNYYSKVNALQIPVIARYSLMPMFNVGLGPVYSMSLGKAEIKDGLGKREIEFDDKSSFGAVLSLQARPTLGGFNLVADARYQMALSETNGSKGNAIQVLLGTTF